MPHVDELLGPAAIAAAGLFAAIALQPVTPPRQVPAPAHATAAEPAPIAAVVRLPTVEVVARRAPALAADARAKPRA